MRKYLLIYPIIWVLSGIIFWILLGKSHPFLFAIAFLWIINPLGLFISSLLIGNEAKHRTWLIWSIPISFGILFMLLGYLTFDLASMLSFGNFTPPSLGMFFIGYAFSMAGILLGRFRQNLFNPKEFL